MNLIKSAEKNILFAAKEAELTINFLEALSTYGNKAFPRHNTDMYNQFFQGLQMMRNAVYTLYMHKIVDCFGLVGVGGEKVIKFSKEKMKKLFNDEEKYHVMHFLDKYGNLKSYYSDEDEKAFREEVKKALEKEVITAYENPTKSNEIG